MSGGVRPASATARRRVLADRAARWLVTGGGLLIIASILGILVFLVVEVRPLFESARVTPTGRLALPVTGADAAVVTDEYRSRLGVLSLDGRVRVLDAHGGGVVEEVGITSDGVRLHGVAVSSGRRPALVGSTGAGTLLAAEIAWHIDFTAGRRVVARLREPVSFELDPGHGALAAFAVRLEEDGAGLAAAILGDGSLSVARRSVTENPITGEQAPRSERFVAPAPAGIATLLVGRAGGTIYGGTSSGAIVSWTLTGDTLGQAHATDPRGAAVTALGLLAGERSLVVGRADGGLEVWFPTRDDPAGLVHVRDFPPQSGAIHRIAASPSGRTFLALGDGGELGLYHSTAERVLWRSTTAFTGGTGLLFTPKADGALLWNGSEVVALDVENPHPEVGLHSYFGRVSYEGYERPEFLWQSSSGSDESEPKLSLVPLMVGTLKGTVYSLALAIPLAVFGAMFASQFLHPRLKRVVKPAVEVMASLPSVVLGFLAGLWLAPRVEAVVPGLIAMIVALPAAVLLAWAGIRALPRRLRTRLTPGAELLPYSIAILAAGFVCLRASPLLERVLFDGSFALWLREATGLAYDQRNALVVAVAMGFAVIPVIFAIAEDAFSNVPRHLVSGSLALGASRWQTVVRVVLPTASPGIFSGIMVGFGRAVGETMIVLMATGNTPLLDWNPFNGFRTLSANIAVEIPEAPHGSTLYRTLFLAALILFAFTFVTNTLAELVRQQLRSRYANL